MSGRILNPAPQYSDDAGSPLVSGKLYFYETGTLTPKDTFADAGLTIANTNPVILDGSGRIPNIFGTGLYKVILTDSDDVQEWERDSVAAVDTGDGGIAAWDSTVTYSAADLVQGSNLTYYRSLANLNVGNEPSVSPLSWEEILTTREDATGRGSDAVSYTGQSMTVTEALDGITDGTIVITPPTHTHTSATTGGVFNSVAQLGTGLDTDGTLAANSDTKVPSQKAVKTFAGLSGARVRRAGNQTIATGSFANVNFDTEDYDTGSFHDTVTNNDRLTVPSGYTHAIVSAQVTWSASAVGSRVATIGQYNSGGSAIRSVAEDSRAACQIAGQRTRGNMTSETITVSAGDYFTLSVLQDSGVSQDITGGVSGVTFSIRVFNG